ncbi:sulfite exporter TauE/SafE family protein [Lactobacillus xujianguonis]|uniref:Probable membrane transporter protein n=1 Tax=Lactobacillus xujianguonis TaxID=2495899 RepID=A0A437SU69_9LACO|nr:MULTISPECIES: sulfite exporter TauE/SafE family protein [Lactobacillus]RVU70493.1 sulfite exporter TauE/SafE family protein [Lactobacillus xujianguonis]RVU76837.1 sulfite exporter TauE/SafE family protein [Lactobacillus xujianguonis]
MTVWMIIGTILIGLITGIVTSLIGASGVTVVVPALTLLFSVNSHIAIGTSLFVDVITSIVVAISYFYHGNVRLKASLWITVGSIIGAQFGSKWVRIISDEKLNIIFAIVLIISGIMTFSRKNKQFDTNKGLHINNRILQTALLLAIGLVIGMISGLVGAGGGVMILLAIIFILHYPMHQAVVLPLLLWQLLLFHL